jgi:hypothetical protein
MLYSFSPSGPAARYSDTHGGLCAARRSLRSEPVAVMNSAGAIMAAMVSFIPLNMFHRPPSAETPGWYGS